MNTLSSLFYILGFITSGVGACIYAVGSVNLFGFPLLDWFIGMTIFSMLATFVSYIVKRNLGQDLDYQSTKTRATYKLSHMLKTGKYHK